MATHKITFQNGAVMKISPTNTPIRGFNPPIPHEFVEPSASDSFIWWLYKRRFIMCKKGASEINEIIPRSRSKSSITDWTNRVTLCQSCHREFHADGVTDFKIKDMQYERRQFLIDIGRAEYIG